MSYLNSGSFIEVSLLYGFAYAATTIIPIFHTIVLYFDVYVRVMDVVPRRVMIKNYAVENLHSSKFFSAGKRL